MPTDYGPWVGGNWENEGCRRKGGCWNGRCLSFQEAWICWICKVRRLSDRPLRIWSLLVAWCPQIPCPRREGYPSWASDLRAEDPQALGY